MNGLSILLAARGADVTRIRQCLAQERSFRIIGCCSNARQACMFARLHRPNLIISTTMLEDSDAFDLLRLLSHSAERPMFLLLSDVPSDVTLQYAADMGADFVMGRPITPERLGYTVRMLARQLPSQPQTHQHAALHRSIQHLLVREGFSSQYCGFHYLAAALYLAFNEPPLLSSLTKSLYAAVAEQHRTSASRVERDLRHIIRVTCLRSGRPVRSNGVMLRELLRQLRRDI